MLFIKIIKCCRYVTQVQSQKIICTKLFPFFKHPLKQHYISQRNSSSDRVVSSSKNKFVKVFSGIVLITCAAVGAYFYTIYQNEVSSESQTIIAVDNIAIEEHQNATVNNFLPARKNFDPVVSKCRDLLLRVKDEIGVPGLVIGVSVDGEVVWQEGLGYSDIENRVKCSPDTVMRIASISKSITMAAVAKLWQEGKLDLDKPIQHYLPDFPLKTFDGKPVEITGRLLISHLAGIRHYNKKENKDEKNDANKNGKNSENAKTTNEFQLKEYYIKDKYTDIQSSLNLFKDDELMNKPGSKFLYSTHGYTLISALVEKVAEEPFTTHMTKLFKKLGMHHTYLDENDVIIYHRSRNYVKGKNSYIINAPYIDNSYKWAGGGFLSNVKDLLNFANVMLYSLQFQPKTVDKNSVSTKPDNKIGKLFHKDSNNPPSLMQVNPGYLTSRTLSTLWTPVVDIKDRDYTYGMGWFVYPENQDCEYCDVRQFCVFHTGGAIGASSVLLILPRNCKAVSSLQCQWEKPPKGIVVTIIANLQEVRLSKTALEIAKMFDGFKS